MINIFIKWSNDSFISGAAGVVFMLAASSCCKLLCVCVAGAQNALLIVVTISHKLEKDSFSAATRHFDYLLGTFCFFFWQGVWLLILKVSNIQATDELTFGFSGSFASLLFPFVVSHLTDSLVYCLLCAFIQIAHCHRSQEIRAASVLSHGARTKR